MKGSIVVRFVGIETLGKLLGNGDFFKFHIVRFVLRRKAKNCKI